MASIKPSRNKSLDSKPISTEYGRRMYAADLPYEEQMDLLTEKYLDSVQLVKQSEFKKPYLEDDYQAMEYSHNPPDTPSLPPDTPADGPPGGIPDCNVGFEASGILEGWRKCDPNDDCSAWIFTCAHKLVDVTCLGCTIREMIYLSGDRIQIIVCSDEDKIDMQYTLVNGKINKFSKERTCLGDNPNPACTNCDDCVGYPPVIGYTTQQMSVNGTQNINASGGAGGPYSWAIISGGGTLSKTSTAANEATLYTAPSSNASCANNPTIRVTDYCNHTADLQIAINAYGTPALAYTTVSWLTAAGAACTNGPDCYAGTIDFCCDSTQGCGGGQVNCTGSCYFGGCPLCDPDLAMACVVANYCTNPGPCGGNCSNKTIDQRTADMITQGCCPAALL